MFKMATTGMQGPEGPSASTKTYVIRPNTEPQNVETGWNLRSLLVQPPHFAVEETEAHRGHHQSGGRYGTGKNPNLCIPAAVS